MGLVADAVVATVRITAIDETGPGFASVKTRAREMETGVAQSSTGVSRSVKTMEKDTHSSLGSMGSSLRDMGKTFMPLLGLGAAAAAAMVVKHFGDMAAEFQSTQTKLENFTSSSKAQMEQYQAEAFKMSNATGLALNDIENGYIQASKAGYEHAAGIRVVAAATKLAVADHVDLKSALDVLAPAMHAFGESGKNAQKDAGILFDAVKHAGKSDLPELGQAMTRAQGPAAALGVKFSDLAALFAAAAEGGMKVRTAGSGILSLLQDMQDPTAKQQAAWADLGIKWGDLATLHGPALVERLKEIEAATGGNYDALRALFGTGPALQTFLTLAKNGFSDVAARQRDGITAANDLKTAFHAAMSDFDRQWSALKTRVENVGLKLALSFLLPTAEAVIHEASTVLAKVETRIESDHALHVALTVDLPHDWSKLQNDLGQLGNAWDKLNGKVKTTHNTHKQFGDYVADELDADIRSLTDVIDQLIKGTDWLAKSTTAVMRSIKRDWDDYQRGQTQTWNQIKATWEGAIKSLQSGFSAFLTWVSDKWQQWVVGAVKWGQQMISLLIQGITGQQESLSKALSDLMGAAGKALIAAAKTVGMAAGNALTGGLLGQLGGLAGQIGNLLGGSGSGGAFSPTGRGSGAFGPSLFGMPASGESAGPGYRAGVPNAYGHTDIQVPQNTKFYLPGGTGARWLLVQKYTGNGWGETEVWQAPNGAQMTFMHMDSMPSISTGKTYPGGTYAGLTGGVPGVAPGVTGYYSSGAHLHVGYQAGAYNYIRGLTGGEGFTNGALISGYGQSYFSGSGASWGGQSGSGPLRLPADIARWTSLIQSASRQTGVPAAVIAAIMEGESHGNPNVTSSAGAMGLMQLMPGSAAKLGIRNPYNPAQNIMGGAQWLAREPGARSGDWRTAISYYAGGGPRVSGSYADRAMMWARQYGLGGGGGAAIPSWIKTPDPQQFGFVESFNKSVDGLTKSIAKLPTAELQQKYTAQISKSIEEPLTRYERTYRQDVAKLDTEYIQKVQKINTEFTGNHARVLQEANAAWTTSSHGLRGYLQDHSTSIAKWLDKHGYDLGVITKTHSEKIGGHVYTHITETKKTFEAHPKEVGAYLMAHPAALHAVLNSHVVDTKQAQAEFINKYVAAHGKSTSDRAKLLADAKSAYQTHLSGLKQTLQNHVSDLRDKLKEIAAAIKAAMDPANVYAAAVKQAADDMAHAVNGLAGLYMQKGATFQSTTGDGSGTGIDIHTGKVVGSDAPGTTVTAFTSAADAFIAAYKTAFDKAKKRADELISAQAAVGDYSGEMAGVQKKYTDAISNDIAGMALGQGDYTAELKDAASNQRTLNDLKLKEADATLKVTAAAGDAAGTLAQLGSQLGGIMNEAKGQAVLSLNPDLATSLGFTPNGQSYSQNLDAYNVAYGKQKQINDSSLQVDIDSAKRRGDWTSYLQGTGSQQQGAVVDEQSKYSAALQGLTTWTVKDQLALQGAVNATNQRSQADLAAKNATTNIWERGSGLITEYMTKTMTGFGRDLGIITTDLIQSGQSAAVAAQSTKQATDMYNAGLYQGYMATGQFTEALGIVSSGISDGLNQAISHEVLDLINHTGSIDKDTAAIVQASIATLALSAAQERAALEAEPIYQRLSTLQTEYAEKLYASEHPLDLQAQAIASTLPPLSDLAAELGSAAAAAQGFSNDMAAGQKIVDAVQKPATSASGPVSESTLIGMGMSQQKMADQAMLDQAAAKENDLQSQLDAINAKLASIQSSSTVTAAATTTTAANTAPVNNDWQQQLVAALRSLSIAYAVSGTRGHMDSGEDFNTIFSSIGRSSVPLGVAGLGA